MDYNPIANYLEKFKKILFAGEEKQRIIVQLIEKNTKIKIDVKMIKVKGTVIYLQGSPMLRSEVLMKKMSILSDLAQLLPDQRFTDIT